MSNAYDDCFFLACDNPPEGVLTDNDRQVYVCEECAARAIKIGAWTQFQPTD